MLPTSRDSTAVSFNVSMYVTMLWAVLPQTAASTVADANECVLSAGVVYWSPPESAVAAAQQACGTPLAHSYGPAVGTKGLWEALQVKVREENGLESVRPPSSDLHTTLGNHSIHTVQLYTVQSIFFLVNSY